MKKCSFCGSSCLIEIDSYKHRWRFCTVCKCAESERKERYPLEVFKAILRPYLRKKGWFQTEKRLLHDLDIDKPTRAWDYFNDETHIDYTKKAAEQFYRELFDYNNFNVAGKDILEISGGSGDIAYYFLGKGAKSVVVSEYNTDVVESIKRRLGIPAFFYDANSQTLANALNRGGGGVAR